VTAATGAEALDAVRTAAPDLVLSDVRMPDMDDFDPLTLLRSDPATRSVPVILLTGQSTTDDAVRGLALGAAVGQRKGDGSVVPTTRSRPRRLAASSASSAAVRASARPSA
jgi:CheY-like chemotaxis protein